MNAARELTPAELNRDFGTADKSVLGTLVHIFAGDRIWLERMHGIQREALVEPGDHDFAQLQEAWPRVHQGWKDWAANLTDAQALEDLEFYRSTTGSMFRMPKWQVAMHVVNHGTQHRGAVLGFLRAMGKTPPKVDLIVHYFARAAASSAAS